MALLFSRNKKTPNQVPLGEKAAKIGSCSDAIFNRALKEGPDHDLDNLRSLQQILETAQAITLETFNKIPYRIQ